MVHSWSFEERFLPKFYSKTNTRFLFRLDLQYNSERKSYFFKVAPYVPKTSGYYTELLSKAKIKKKDHLKLDLKKNIDILNYVSKHNSLRPKIVIGFAAETNDVLNNAKKKLIEKNCDWIVANDVSNKKIGFNSDFNEVSIFYKNDKVDKLKYKPKSEISDELVEKIVNHLD